MVNPPTATPEKKKLEEGRRAPPRRQHSAATVRIRTQPWMVIGQPPTSTGATTEEQRPATSGPRGREAQSRRYLLSNADTAPTAVDDGVAELTSAEQVGFIVKENGKGLPFNKRSSALAMMSEANANRGAGALEVDKKLTALVETQIAMSEAAVTKVFTAKPAPPSTKRTQQGANTALLSQEQRNKLKWSKQRESARVSTEATRKTLKLSEFKGAVDGGSAIGNLTRWPAPANPSIDLLEECTRLLRQSAAAASKNDAATNVVGGKKAILEKAAEVGIDDVDDPAQPAPPPPVSSWIPPPQNAHVDVSVDVLGKVLRNFRHIVVDKEEASHPAQPNSTSGAPPPATAPISDATSFDLVSFFSNLDGIVQNSFEHEMEEHRQRVESHVDNDVLPAYQAVVATLQDVEKMTDEKATHAEKKRNLQTTKFEEEVSSVRAEVEDLMVEGLSREDRLIQLNRRYAILHDRFTSMSSIVTKQRELTSTLASLSKLNSQLHYDVSTMTIQLENVKVYKDRVKQEAEVELRGVEDEQDDMVQELRSALAEIQWYGERQRSVKLRLQEEAQREFYIRDEIDKWKDKALNQPIERSANLTPRPKWDENELLDTCHLRTALHHLKSREQNIQRRSQTDNKKRFGDVSPPRLSRSASPSSSASGTPQGGGSPTAQRSSVHRMSTLGALSFEEEIEQKIQLTTEEHVSIILGRLTMHQKQAKTLVQEQQRIKARPGMAKLLESASTTVPFSLHHVSSMLPKSDSVVYRAVEHSAGSGLQNVMPIWNESDTMAKCLFLWLHMLRRRGKKPALDTLSAQDASVAAIMNTSTSMESSQLSLAAAVATSMPPGGPTSKHYNSIRHSVDELLDEMKTNENNIRDAERALELQQSPAQGIVPLIGSTANLAVEPGRRISELGYNTGAPLTKLLLPAFLQDQAKASGGLDHRFSIASAFSEGAASDGTQLPDILGSVENNSLVPTDATSPFGSVPVEKTIFNVGNVTPLVGSGFTGPLPTPREGRQRLQSVVVLDPTPADIQPALVHGAGTKVFGGFTKKPSTMLLENDLHSLFFLLGKMFPQSATTHTNQVLVPKTQEKFHHRAGSPSPPGSATTSPKGSHAFATRSNRSAITAAVRSSNSRGSVSQRGGSQRQSLATTHDTGASFIDGQQVAQAIQASQDSILLNLQVNQPSSGAFMHCFHQVLSHSAPLRLLDLFLWMTKRVVESCETTYTQHYRGQYLPQVVLIRAVKKAYDERQMSSVFKVDCLKALQGVNSIDWHGDFHTEIPGGGSSGTGASSAHSTSFSGTPASHQATSTENIFTSAIKNPICEVTSCSKRISEAIDPDKIVDAYFSGDCRASSTTPFPATPILAPMFNRMMSHLHAEQQYLLSIVGKVMTDVSIASETRPGFFMMSVEKFEQALAEEVVQTTNAGLPSSLGAPRVKPRPGHFLSPRLGVRGVQQSKHGAVPGSAGDLDLQDSTFGDNAISMMHAHKDSVETREDGADGGFSINAALLAEHIAKGCSTISGSEHFIKAPPVEETRTAAPSRSADSSASLTPRALLVANPPAAATPRTADLNVMNDSVPDPRIANARDTSPMSSNGDLRIDVDEDDTTKSLPPSPGHEALPAVSVQVASPKKGRKISSEKQRHRRGDTFEGSHSNSTSRRGSLSTSAVSGQNSQHQAKAVHPRIVTTIAGHTAFVTPHSRQRNALAFIFHTALLERDENLREEVFGVQYQRDRIGSESRSHSRSSSRALSLRGGSKSFEDQKASVRRRSSGNASSSATTPRSSLLVANKQKLPPSRHGSGKRDGPLDGDASFTGSASHESGGSDEEATPRDKFANPTCIDDVFIVDGNKEAIIVAEDVVDVEGAFARARMLCIRMYLREIQ